MKTKTIEDNWPERVIQIPTGEQIRLTADDPEDVTEVVARNSENRTIGAICFSFQEDENNGDQFLLISHLDLYKLGAGYTRQGIGEAIIQMVKDHYDYYPIVARCPRSETKQHDGSHLTGIGPNFVIKMRELGLIEEYCYDHWCSCKPEGFDDREEEYSEDYGLTD